MSSTYIERCLGLNGILCPIVPVNDCTSGILILDRQLAKRYLLWDWDADEFLRKGDRIIVGWAEEEIATFWQRCKCWLKTRRWFPADSIFYDVLGEGN